MMLLPPHRVRVCNGFPTCTLHGSWERAGWGSEMKWNQAETTVCWNKSCHNNNNNSMDATVYAWPSCAAVCRGHILQLLINDQCFQLDSFFWHLALLRKKYVLRGLCVRRSRVSESRQTNRDIWPWRCFEGPPYVLTLSQPTLISQNPLTPKWV